MIFLKHPLGVKNRSRLIGDISILKNAPRRFAQQIVLAPQGPLKYYVVNDIFRYIDETDEPAENDMGTYQSLLDYILLPETQHMAVSETESSSEGPEEDVNQGIPPGHPHLGVHVSGVAVVADHQHPTDHQVGVSTDSNVENQSSIRSVINSAPSDHNPVDVEISSSYSDGNFMMTNNSVTHINGSREISQTDIPAQNETLNMMDSQHGYETYSKYT